MRVLHVSKVTGIAGSENHLLILLRGLRERGIDARLLLLVEPGRPVPEFDDAAADIPLPRLTIRRDVDPVLLPRLVQTIRALRPDAVHTHLFHADLYGTLAARLAGVPVVVTSRHNDNAFRRRPPYRQINRFLWGRVDGGIAISEAIRRFCIDVEGAPSDRVQTIHYGLDPASLPAVDRDTARADLRARLDLPPEALLCGMVCRLIEQKGIPYALEAFQQVAADHPLAHLVLAGDGPLRPSLAAQAASLGIADRVHFLGWQAQTAPVFAALDVFLMPSLWEGFGLVLLEAMAQAVPVVGSEVSAIPEVVAHGETGLLCPPRDAACLARALGELLADPVRRTALGRAGQERLAAHFSPARMIDCTAALYARLIAEKRDSR